MSSFSDAKLLWQQIVNATDISEFQENKGLRNRLFLDLKKPFNLRLKLIYFFKIAILFFAYPRKLIINIEKGKILFYFPFKTSAMLGNLLPIYKETKKNANDGLIIKTQKITLFENAMCKEDIYKFTNYLQRFRFLLRAVKANHNLYFQFRKTDRSLAKKYANNYLNALYHLYLIFLTQSVFEEIMVKAQPLSVVSTSDYFPIDFALFQSANKMNIPNFLIQHGIVGISYYPFTAAKIFVYGKASYKDLIDKGCKGERLICSGMPASDSSFNLKKEPKINNGYSISKSRISIVILSDSQGNVIYPDVYSKYKQILHELLSNNYQIDFYIKLHPAENQDFYSEQFLNASNLHVLPKNTSLDEAFDIADFCMTIWSTAGLDAIIAGKPLIVLDVLEIVREYAYWPIYNGGVYLTELEAYKKNFELDVTNSFKERIVERQNGFLNYYFEKHGNSSRYINSIITNG